MGRWRKLLRPGSAGALPVADVMRFEPLARKRLSPMAYDYLRSGGADEITMRENRRGFDRLRLAPRVLVDVSKIDTRLSLFGCELEFPMLLAPIAYHRLFHAEGELATALGASAAGAALTVSTFTTTAIEDIARSTRQPFWFQLYVQRDRDFTRGMVQRAVAAGAKVVCLTADTPVLGCRYGQLAFHLPQGVECVHLRGLRAAGQVTGYQSQGAKTYDNLLDPTMNWKDLEWLRSAAGVPVVIKGVLTPEDAVRAIDAGADGLIVSTHGGRNLDGLPAAIDALPRVAEAVRGRIPVMLDSGIRRGTDVLMALALGARAVFIGRPYIYGLAAGGAEGVERVVNILRDEFARAMALTGRTSLAEIDSSVLWPKQAEAP
jgi:4-hydroxymandelate oxidase